MTGTADTEAEEFAKIYNLDVRVVPTNKPMIRADVGRRRLQDREGEVRRGGRGAQGAARHGPAGAGGHGVDQQVGGLRQVPQGRGRAARGAQRQEPRARGRHHRAGGPQGRGHHLHQHGRPRHRHPAGRQPREPGQGRGRAPAGRGRRQRQTTSRRRTALRPLPGRAGRVGRRSTRRRCAKFKAQCDAEREEVLKLGGLFILGTERHESRRIDNQLRGRAGRQGDPGWQPLLPLARRRPDAHLRRRPHHQPDGDDGHEGGRGHRALVALARHRERAEAGRRAQLRHPQEPARVRRRDEPAAQDHLRAAPPGARRRRRRCRWSSSPRTRRRASRRATRR